MSTLNMSDIIAEPVALDSEGAQQVPDDLAGVQVEMNSYE